MLFFVLALSLRGRATIDQEIGVLPIGLFYGELERRNMRRFKFLHGRPVQNDAAFPKRCDSSSMRRVRNMSMTLRHLG